MASVEPWEMPDLVVLIAKLQERYYKRFKYTYGSETIQKVRFN
jgi:hypothetical protein